MQFVAAAMAFLAQDIPGELASTDGRSAMVIESQDVSIRIDNALAITTITQVFRNKEGVQREAFYSFPVPRDASVSNLSLWVDGKEVIGEVVERRKAQTIYENIISTRRDPGLLEQASYKLFRARIFPVPARGTQKIQIAYYQPVDYDGGTVTYTYPLESRGREQARVEGTLRITADVASALPIRRLWSPSHAHAAAQRTAANRWRVSTEAAGARLERDFVLLYELERERTGLTLVPYRRRGEDGYFMLVLTAGRELDQVERPTNWIFMLDVSGSMGEERKLETAVRATEQLLAALSATDTFNVITFNLAPEKFEHRPVPAHDGFRKAALAWLRGQKPRGGTDIVPALEQAADMAMPGRSNVVVLLSDGNAMDAEDHSAFRPLLERKAPVRIFSIGIGNDANVPLLATLAERTGGYADLVSTVDDVDRKVKQLQRKVMHRVAENLDVRFEGVSVDCVTPEIFTCLFRGAQSVIYGRYRGAGRARVIVEGDIGDEKKELAAEVEFPSEDGLHPEVRRMWAWKRTDDLMREMRLKGENARLAREIVELGCRHSIVTPLTSMLVLESEAQYAQFGIERRNPDRIAEERLAQRQRQTYDYRSSGRGAFGGFGGGSVEAGLAALVVAFLLLRRRAA